MTQTVARMSNQKVPAQWPSYSSENFWPQEHLMQERELAFFFLDIRDFTPFIASRPALEVMHLLKQLFQIFREAIGTHGGTIIETAGDGFYAVFGLDEPVLTATAEAVKAGFSILEQLDEANKTCFGPFFNHHFQVGIGLHVGKAIVGELGLGVNNNMTVMGYAVNVAARLQQATKPLNNNFIISSDVYHMLPKPPLAAFRQITLKGISEEVNVYLLGEAYPCASCRNNAWKVAS